MQTTQLVIDHMLAYFQNFLEVPREAFGGLPICPFVRQGRLRDTILWHVGRLDDLIELLVQVQHYSLNRPRWEVLVCVDTHKLSEATLEEVAEQLRRLAGPALEIFTGHPESEFRAGGLYTRREPYPNLIVQDAQLLASLRGQLAKGGRYPL